MVMQRTVNPWVYPNAGSSPASGAKRQRLNLLMQIDRLAERRYINFSAFSMIDWRQTEYMRDMKDILETPTRDLTSDDKYRLGSRLHYINKFSERHADKAKDLYEEEDYKQAYLELWEAYKYEREFYTILAKIVPQIQSVWNSE